MEDDHRCPGGEPNGGSEDNPGVLVGAQWIIGGSPTCPGGSRNTGMHRQMTCTFGPTYEVEGAGHPMAPPNYDRNPISFQIVLYACNTIFTQCEDCTKIKNGFLSNNSSTNKKSNKLVTRMHVEFMPSDGEC